MAKVRNKIVRADLNDVPLIQQIELELPIFKKEVRKAIYYKLWEHDNKMLTVTMIDLEETYKTILTTYQDKISYGHIIKLPEINEYEFMNQFQNAIRKLY